MLLDLELERYLTRREMVPSARPGLTSESLQFCKAAMAHERNLHSAIVSFVEAPHAQNLAKVLDLQASIIIGLLASMRMLGVSPEDLLLQAIRATEPYSSFNMIVQRPHHDIDTPAP